MLEILGNIYDRSIVIVFGTVFFSYFWRLWKLIFWQKNFKILSLFFYLKNSRTGSRKTSITQELLVIESCPNPRWVTFLIFCRLVYDISSHLNDLILARSILLQVSHQNSKFSLQKVSYQNWRLVYEIFQFLKQAVSATWYADSNLVIIMELKRKIEYCWAFTFWTSHGFKGYRNLPFAWDGVKYNKLSIATGMTSTSTFFFKKKIFNMNLFDSQLMHNWQYFFFVLTK